MKRMRTRGQGKVSDENSNLKVDLKTAKQKRPRKVLAERTNSGSDLNNSSPKCKPTPKPKPQIYQARPQRVKHLPSRLKDHELSPAQSKIKTGPCTSTPLLNQISVGKSYKTIQKLSPIQEPKVVGIKKRIERDKVAIGTVKRYQNANVTSSPKKIFFPTRADKSQSTKCSTPIYKKKTTEIKFGTDKLALYDFEFDPKNEPATATKKKRPKRIPTKDGDGKPKKRKKMLSRKSTDAAMKMLIEEVKKIQAENMMKKLVSKINSKKVVNVPIGSNPISIPQVQEIVPEVAEDLMDRSLPSSPIDFDPVEDDDCGEFVQNLMSSTRLSEKPSGSPWRMDLYSDVKKWRYNFYVKPSMTPAYERDTFHVLGLDDKVPNRSDVQKPTTSTPNATTKFKQTSILSFYEESFRKSPRKRASSPKKTTPVKYNFDEYSVAQVESNESEVVEPIPEPAIDNCFGFDDDIDADQENVSPSKSPEQARKTLRKLRGRRVAVLAEVKQLPSVPSRLTTHQMKNVLQKKQSSPEKSVVVEEEVVRIEPLEFSQSSDDSDAVNITEDVTQNEIALFEDPVPVAVVHHAMPARRSYERRRRPPVRFQNVEEHTEDENESDEEPQIDCANYIISAKTFKKRKAKKIVPKQMSKKEVKEAEEWAAGFNSMLEEVEDFPLCIE